MNLRQTDILDLARRDGKVTVYGLARQFSVTLQTIRRDLTDLAETGRLVRVHGGAILPSDTTNIAYEERRNLNATAKQAIARACADAIPDGSTIFLNIGTTTEAVARALLHHSGLSVVTNNINVARILAANRGARVTLTGGDLRAADGGLLGQLTNDAIARFKMDIAVIGCSAIDLDGDMMDFDSTEVSASQAIIAHTRRVFVVADHSKFLRSAPARIAPLACAERFFSDQTPPESVTRACKETQMHIAAGD